MTAEYRMCVRCIMDTTAPNIVFDSLGCCSFCSEYFDRVKDEVQMLPRQRADRLDRLIQKIKQQGRGKEYDCVVGVSGGVDSSWVLVKAVEYGLRPLAVHMDNGWNSEIAQNNIERLVTTLGVDLFTYVIEWDEYRKLMQSFFDADVIDVELLYDNAMLSVNFNQASKNGIDSILSGSNHATEGLLIPEGWNWHKYDARNIRSIARSGDVKLSSFPSIGTLDYLRFRLMKRIFWIPFLDYFDYRKDEAIAILEERYGFKPYAQKHFESVFTRFYQAEILPRKFGVDKRLLHFSSLIVSGQMSRDDALSALEQPIYSSEGKRAEDLAYFLKKMGWTEEDFDRYISRPPVPHYFYGTEHHLWILALRAKSWLKRH